MSLLLLTLTSALASTQTTAGHPHDLIQPESVVVHGDVVAVENCVSPAQTAVHTLVTLDVGVPVHGSFQPAPGDPPNLLRVRYAGGEWPDGERSAVAGTPLLAPGDEVFLSLYYGPNGEPLLVPQVFGERGLYRVVDTPEGPVVLSGDGRLVTQSEDGRPVLGPLVAGARANLPFAETFDTPRVLEQVAYYRNLVGPPAPSGAEGPWQGRLLLDATFQGSESTDSQCLASLTGQVDQGVLELSGSCYGPAGTIDLLAVAQHQAGTWSGTLDAVPRHPDLPSQSVPFQASGSGLESLSVVTSDSGVVDGEPLIVDAHLIGRFVGPRPIMPAAAFAQWLTNEAEGPGGFGQSVASGIASCPDDEVVAPLSTSN